MKMSYSNLDLDLKDYDTVAYVNPKSCKGNGNCNCVVVVFENVLPPPSTSPSLTPFTAEGYDPTPRSQSDDQLDAHISLDQVSTWLNIHSGDIFKLINGLWNLVGNIKSTSNPLGSLLPSAASPSLSTPLSLQTPSLPQVPLQTLPPQAQNSSNQSSNSSNQSSNSQPSNSQSSHSFVAKLSVSQSVVFPIQLNFTNDVNDRNFNGSEYKAREAGNYLFHLNLQFTSDLQNESQFKLDFFQNDVISHSDYLFVKFARDSLTSKFLGSTSVVYPTRLQPNDRLRLQLTPLTLNSVSQINTDSIFSGYKL